jgi:pimeloyl-ACP methyl ester carboxylesterase
MALHRWRTSVFTRAAVIASLAVALCVAIVLALSGSSRAAGGTTTYTGSFADGATYLIQVPDPWNGTLLLYSHGYVVPGSPNPPADVGDPLTGAYLLSHGFALAGSSYAGTGWAIKEAIPDQIHTLNTFDTLVGKPTRTIAWGHSLGGMITAGLLQDDPSRFDAALPMCGVLAGGVGTWNQALDAEFAIQQLLPGGSALQLVNITNPVGNLTTAEEVIAAAQATPQGRARLALAGALADLPGWFTTGSPEPAATDYAAQEANQYLWDTEVDGPFIFDFRQELEQRAGGNPSWNTGVNYWKQLENSIDLNEVKALYATAGLNLAADINTLNSAPRISADPKAVAYLTQNIVYNGNLDDKPVLTMHTTGDGLVANEDEQAYRSVVDRAGDARFLRQVFVNRAGHCAFTPAETITALQALIQRLNTGHWQGVDPSDFNATAASLGSALNTYPPAFIDYQPSPFLRPFDLGRFHFGGNPFAGNPFGGHDFGRRGFGRH